MNTRISRHFSILLLAVLLFGLIAGDASAQTIIPPKPGEIEGVSPLPSYIIGLLLVGAAIALTALPSKRSHED